MNQNLPYLALGILVGLITPYALALIKKPQSVPTKTSPKEKPINES